MPTDKVKINRAPVLTLWAVVVAERLGHDPEAALSLGKAVAGLNAQSKGRRLGIFMPAEEEGKGKKKEKEAADKAQMVTLLGRPVPTIRTKAGLRAAIGGEPIDPESVRRYLEKKFGENLPPVRAALEALANAYEPEALAVRAFSLYETFRPKVPEGTRGWGAAGELDLGQLRLLARRRTPGG